MPFPFWQRLAPVVEHGGTGLPIPLFHVAFACGFYGSRGSSEIDVR